MRVMRSTDERVPLLERDDFREASVFRPEVTMREARRQMSLRSGPVPTVCILDPDGVKPVFIQMLP